VDVTALRIRANQKIIDLGPEPGDAHDAAMWREERRGAVVLLAELADNDTELLRQAATGEWVEIAARDLLLDAAAEVCAAWGDDPKA
jgi:hypothetical protein